MHANPFSGCASNQPVLFKISLFLSPDCYCLKLKEEILVYPMNGFYLQHKLIFFMKKVYATLNTNNIL